jgi:5-formyltetrahydrofolate cyclo-ligase
VPNPLEKTLQEKQELRARASARREARQETDLLSRRIWDKMLILPEFVHSRTIMTYLDIGSEVRTCGYVPELRRLEKRVVVPYCRAHELKLFELKDMDELSPGMWQILEPKPEWRSRPDRQVDAAELDLILVPGVAFDRRGDRLGLGKGYYDRFLQHVRPDAVKISPAYECQLVDKIPVLPHDVRVDMVVTEDAVYRAGKRIY